MEGWQFKSGSASGLLQASVQPSTRVTPCLLSLSPSLQTPSSRCSAHTEHLTSASDANAATTRLLCHLEPSLTMRMLLDGVQQRSVPPQPVRQRFERDVQQKPFSILLPFVSSLKFSILQSGHNSFSPSLLHRPSLHSIYQPANARAGQTFGRYSAQLVEQNRSTSNRQQAASKQEPHSSSSEQGAGS